MISRRDRSGEIEETYDFFSAGRAVSENLRLDRSLAPIDGGEPTIPIETLKGIETKAFDWTAATAKLSPAKDPLAALIPEDQHAAFFPSLTVLADTLDAIEAQAAPIASSVTERSEDAGIRAFYERQLGFKLRDVAAAVRGRRHIRRDHGLGSLLRDRHGRRRAARVHPARSAVYARQSRSHHAGLP